MGKSPRSNCATRLGWAPRIVAAYSRGRVSLPARVVVLVIGSLMSACPAPTAPPTKPPPVVAPPPVTAKPPVTAAPVDPVVQISSRAFHTCGVRRSGTVLCWGKNSYGQLGDGTRDDTNKAVHVTGIRDAVEVAVGVDFSCVRHRGGTASCWGNDQDGQLGGGKGGRPGVFSLSPKAVFGTKDVVQLSAGDYHACARLRAGAVRCWGNAESGQIGIDDARVVPSPRTIAQIGDAVAIASGGAHVCVALRSGKVMCWGRNTEGQLGDGKSGSRVRPVEVARLTDAIAVSSGSNWTCARRRAGQIACWGDNAGGQLGNGARGEPKRYEPVAMAGLAQVEELALGAAHGCARQKSGTVLCWGANDTGQLGSPRSGAAVKGLLDATAIAMGARHGCAVRGKGDVACWGTNEFGALGPRPLR